jgi:uncharacterized protein YhhL (DUF1145 family)
MVRPVLFSYGLLRYRLLGTQIKAERALAVVVTVIISTVFGLLILNIITKEPTTLTVTVAVLSGLVLLFPCWKISNRFLERLLASNIEAQDMSMRERRNIYLMGLQTAVVHGVLEDEDDKRAIKNLKEELAITDREHDLLMDGITLHEARLIPEKRVEGAYLIHTHGLLISSFKETDEEELDEEGTDSDIFAGMLTAITEFVDETMKKGGEGMKKRTTGSISYGPTTLVVEREGHIVLAVLIDGPDDLELRQLIRDTLSDINERFGDILGKEWDGDLRGLEGIDRILIGFAARVKRRS